MIWALDMDDFRDHCGYGKYPLIKAVREELEHYNVKFVYDGPYERSAASLISAKGTPKDRKIINNPSSMLIYTLIQPR